MIHIKAKQSIFPTPIQTKEERKEKKRIPLQGWIYSALAALLMVPYSIFFLYPQMDAYLNFEEKMSKVKGQIEEAEEDILSLKESRETYQADYNEKWRAEKEIMQRVFPESPEKLEIIRLMENFATYLQTSFPPFEFTSITFDAPVKEKGFTVLPFQTAIHASEKNFERFLTFISLSGDYKPKSPDHIRLMEIANISVHYRGVDEKGKDQGVDFNVELKAYSM